MGGRRGEGDHAVGEPGRDPRDPQVDICADDHHKNQNSDDGTEGLLGLEQSRAHGLGSPPHLLRGLGDVASDGGHRFRNDADGGAGGGDLGGRSRKDDGDR